MSKKEQLNLVPAEFEFWARENKKKRVAMIMSGYRAHYRNVENLEGKTPSMTRTFFVACAIADDDEIERQLEERRSNND